MVIKFYELVISKGTTRFLIWRVVGNVDPYQYTGSVPYTKYSLSLHMLKTSMTSYFLGRRGRGMNWRFYTYGLPLPRRKNLVFSLKHTSSVHSFYTSSVLDFVPPLRYSQDLANTNLIVCLFPPFSENEMNSVPIKKETMLST